jgi:UMF1 family MFS transporter
LFSRLSEKIGNINTLKITIVIWGFICVAAYLLDAKSKSIDIQFYALGATIGMVLGAIQSLSAPLTQNYYPETEDHATYFSFFDVTEK